MRSLGIIIILVLLLLPAMAQATPDVKITVLAEKQIVVEENGQKVVKRVPAENIQPGETVIYQLHYENKGDDDAVNAVIVDPMPDNTIYIDGSAFGAGSDIDFSIDGGKSYKKPSLLTYDVAVADGKKEQRTASPEQYTHIRWTVHVIPAGKSGMASFQVRVQ
ncbi:MAG: hypothetical protein R8L53_04765 [Mariprofundales bacterium]